MPQELLEYKIASTLRDRLATEYEPRLNMSPNAQLVFKDVYCKRLETGQPETIAQRMAAIAVDVASADLSYLPDTLSPEARVEHVERTAKRYLERYVNNEFRANTPTNINFGRWQAKYDDNGNLIGYSMKEQLGSACFVIPVEDTFGETTEKVSESDGILAAWVEQQLLQKGGGGTGMAFSALRPKGSILGYNPIVDGMKSLDWDHSRGISSGYESFLNYFYNSATEAIMQGSSRRGANMGIQRIDHMDFLDHIFAKYGRGEDRLEKRIKNFNLSLAVTDEFMEAVLNNGTYTLYNPHRASSRIRKTLQDKFGIKDPEIVRKADIATREQFERILGMNRQNPLQPVTTPNMYLDSNGVDVINAYTGTKIGMIVDDIVRIDAARILDLIVDASQKNGEPGMVFIDRINEFNPILRILEYEATNPCVAGDTLVSTEFGLMRMSQLVAKHGDGTIQVVTDNRVPIKVQNYDGSILYLEQKEKGVSLHTISKAFKTGIKKVYILETRSGYEIKCTLDHKIFTNDGFIALSQLNPDKHFIYVQAGEGQFNPNYNLPFEIKNEFKGKNGRKYSLALPNKWSKELGQVIGWLIGDGWLIDHHKNCRVGFTFSQDDLNVLKHLRQILNTYYGKDIREIKRDNNVFHLSYHSKYFVEFFKQLGVLPVSAEEKMVPETLYTSPKEAVIGFLQGLFTADGTTSGKNRNGSSYIRLTSKSIRLLKGVQILLLNLGIKSKIYNRSRNERISFKYKTTKGEFREYKNDGKLFELNISKDNIKRFIEEVGFLFDIHRPRIKSIAKINFQKELFQEPIKGIKFIGEELVYDLTEPVTHSFIGNSIVLSNCAEQPLPPHAACNLGSINAGKFARYSTFPSKEQITLDELILQDEFTRIEQRVDRTIGVMYFDWNALDSTIVDGIRFLDNVIDRSDFPSQKVSNAVQRTRKIGLGYMGIWDAMVLMKIRYGSDESLSFAEALAKRMHDKSRETSMKLAEERGVFPDWESSFFNPDSEHHNWFTSNPLTITDKYRGTRRLSDKVNRTRKMTYGIKVRNSYQTTEAPTGTIRRTVGEVLKDLPVAIDNLAISSGIEPIFTLFEESNIINTSIRDSSQAAAQLLAREGVLTEKVIQAIKGNRGSAHIYKYTSKEVAEVLETIPEDVRKVLVTAAGGADGHYEITAQQHVKISSIFQQYTDSAISKTINLPSTATLDDIKQAWIELWKSGAKGGTVYRDKSRRFQILNVVEDTKNTENNKVIRPLLQYSITVQLPFMGTKSTDGALVDGNPDMCFTTLTFNPINNRLTGVFQNIANINPELLSLLTHANIELSRTLKNGRSIDDVIGDLEKVRIESSTKGIIIDKAVIPNGSTDEFRYQVDGATTRGDLLNALYVARFLTDGGSKFEQKTIQERADLYFSGRVSLRSIINSKGQLKLEERTNGNPSILDQDKIITLPENTPKSLCPECG